MSDPTLPPHSMEAERAVLGAMLADATLLGDLLATVRPEHLYHPPHQDIYDTIAGLAAAGEPVELGSLTVALRRAGLLDRCGGPGYLALLLEHAAPANALYYAEILHEQAVRRRLLAFHTRGAQQVQDGTGLTLTEILDGALAELDAVAGGSTGGDVEPVDKPLAATLEHIDELSRRDGQLTGLPTGFYDLDEMTSGLHPGQMVTVAARPGVGKSTLGLDFARAAAIRHNQPVLLFSLEMSKTEIITRLLAAEARVGLQKLRTGRLEDAEWARISSKMPAIANAPLFLDDTAHITMPEIRAKARRVRQRHGLALVIVDYLQLMAGEGRVESRQQEVSQISRGCKLLAKDLAVPMVVMSQLNRGAEHRSDRRPQVSDLRESGAIEQDSDVIILLYREDMVDPESARVGEADLIVGKQRNGPTGVVTVAFQGHYSRFVDMQKEPSMPAVAR